MRIQLLSVGFNRSVDYVADSLAQNVLNPLSYSGHDVSFDGFFSYANKRVQGNRGAIEDFVVSDKLDKSTMALFSKTEMIDEREFFDDAEKIFAKAKEFGDPWPETQFKSLWNVINHLLISKAALKVVDKKADLVYAIRSDLEAVTQFDLDSIKFWLPSHLVTPIWQHYGFINDRAVIATPDLVSKYLSRVDQVTKFLGIDKSPLHAERFLSYSMKCVPNASVNNQMFRRVRAGGVRVSEPNQQDNARTFILGHWQKNR